METPLNLKADRVIRVAQPSVTDLEKAFVAQALDDNQLSCGPRNAEFEQLFAQAHDRKYGVTCNSGTTALMLALRALNVSAGQKVAMPTLTMVACPNAVLSVGGIPHFVDSEPETGNANWQRQSNNCAAYMVVHLYGVIGDFWSLPKSRVIEDCAEATFANDHCGRKAGSRGAIAAFSTFANKVLTTGEGGVVLTDDADVEDRLKSIRAHAFTKHEHFEHKEMAWGVRMTELQAAIGLAQLARKEELLRKREEVAKHYQQLLSGVWWLETMLRPPGSVWWVYPVLIRKGTKYTKDEVRRHLHEHGVETRSFFKPMHLQPHLKEFAHGKFPVAERLFEVGFYLPLHTSMTESDVSYIADLLGAI